MITFRTLAVSLLLALTVALVPAQEPQNFSYWTGEELKTWEKKLAGKSVTHNLQKYDKYFFAVVHREQSSPGESHARVADTYICQTGEATIVFGGEIPNGKAQASGDTFGDDIRGGTRRPLVPGVVAHIPAGMPHQVVVAPGQQVTYMIIKIEI